MTQFSSCLLHFCCCIYPEILIVHHIACLQLLHELVKNKKTCLVTLPMSILERPSTEDSHPGRTSPQKTSISPQTRCVSRALKSPSYERSMSLHYILVVGANFNYQFDSKFVSCLSKPQKSCVKIKLIIYIRLAFLRFHFLGLCLSV